VLWPLRVALTGQEKSPRSIPSAAILGREESLKRIARGPLQARLNRMACKLKIATLVLAGFFAASACAYAQSADDIQAKIDQRNADIQSLEKEIQNYQGQLNALSGQESSLKDTLTSLNLTQKKLQADISVTQDKIDSTTSRSSSFPRRSVRPRPTSPMMTASWPNRFR